MTRPSDNRPELVRNAVYRSLKNLKVEYIDLYLIHWPITFQKQAERDKDDMSFFYCPEKDEDKLGYLSKLLNRYKPDIIDAVWKELEALVDEVYSNLLLKGETKINWNQQL